MAINQLSTPGPTGTIDKKQVKYLNKDYSEFKRSLVEFTKFYFPDTYQDFTDASPGGIFIDMASYVGDVLSYYTDHTFNESLLAYAEETENITMLAQGLGFKPRLVSPSFCKSSISVIVPTVSPGGAMDTLYLPRIAPGSSFRATTQFDAGTFILQDVCDFAVDNGDREIREIAGGNAYLVTKTGVKLTAVTRKTKEFVVGDVQKFLKLVLDDDNVVEIVSVVDSEGNTWYEVDNLTQDYIFTDVLSDINNANSILYKIKRTKVNRRFVSRFNRQLQWELTFGSGNGNLSDVYETPDYKSVYDQQYLQNMTNVALDTINFTNSNSFGLAPSNTTITVTYRVANGLSSNVPAGTVTQVGDLNTLNETRTMSGAELSTFNTMLSSLVITNTEPARGGINRMTPEQLRQSAMGFVNAQGRVVTSQDYEKRVLSMPGKYGAIAKAFAMKDDAITAIINSNADVYPSVLTGNPDDDIQYVPDRPINNNINLYVLGYDNDGRITTVNDTVKENLKQFLSGYRLLTDRINIVDAFRVSIGVNYNITVYNGYNIYDVVTRCSSVIAQYFEIDKWEINQPIIIDDILATLVCSVDGLQTVNSIQIVNKFQQQNGRDYAPYSYSIQSNTTDNIVYPSADPCIFELRYPQHDIVGTGRQ